MLDGMAITVKLAWVEIDIPAFNLEVVK